MLFREALPADFAATMKVRLAVKENVLSNHALVTEAHYLAILESGGKGWVCEVEGQVVGFSIVDLLERNIWALFVAPGFEKMGIGKKLHKLMLDWTFEQEIDALCLSTDPGTRADLFYRQAGWTRTSILTNGEVRYEITKNQWKTGMHP